jgi:hypothetical protein
VCEGTGESVRALAEVGVDIVSLANNHGMDFGAEPNLAVLGRDIVCEVLVSVNTGRRARDDDRPTAPALYHVRDRRLGGVPGTRQVRVDHVARVLRGDLVAARVADDAGVGAHDVETTG